MKAKLLMQLILINILLILSINGRIIVKREIVDDITTEISDIKTTTVRSLQFDNNGTSNLDNIEINDNDDVTSEPDNEADDEGVTIGISDDIRFDITKYTSNYNNDSNRKQNDTIENEQIQTTTIIFSADSEKRFEDMILTTPETRFFDEKHAEYKISTHDEQEDEREESVTSTTTVNDLVINTTDNNDNYDNDDNVSITTNDINLIDIHENSTNEKHSTIFYNKTEIQQTIFNSNTNEFKNDNQTITNNGTQNLKEKKGRNLQNSDNIKTDETITESITENIIVSPTDSLWALAAMKNVEQMTSQIGQYYNMTSEKNSDQENDGFITKTIADWAAIMENYEYNNETMQHEMTTENNNYNNIDDDDDANNNNEMTTINNNIKNVTDDNLRDASVDENKVITVTAKTASITLNEIKSTISDSLDNVNLDTDFDTVIDIFSKTTETTITNTSGISKDYANDSTSYERNTLPTDENINPDKNYYSTYGGSSNEVYPTPSYDTTPNNYYLIDGLTTDLVESSSGFNINNNNDVTTNSGEVSIRSRGSIKYDRTPPTTPRMRATTTDNSFSTENNFIIDEETRKSTSSVYHNNIIITATDSSNHHSHDYSTDFTIKIETLDTQGSSNSPNYISVPTFTESTNKKFDNTFDTNSIERSTEINSVITNHGDLKYSKVFNEDDEKPQTELSETNVITDKINEIDDGTTTLLPPMTDEEIGTEEEPDVNAIIAVSVSVVAIIALVLLVGFLFIMRKRQKQLTYGQRCRVVGLDAYSLDNVSVYNSVRRKANLRLSKRSYGNSGFEDPSLKPNLLNISTLTTFLSNQNTIFEEFKDLPMVTARVEEVPSGCEEKNRYANVVPLVETRVHLKQLNDDEKTEYINANFIKGPKDTNNYYIACQAPLESTISDFWRMIWEQNSKVIIMATDLNENGIEKCADYLPPSVVLDCHRLFNDFQVTLKNREVKEKYAVSTVQLKNMTTNTWREITHFWYQWPDTGVPNDEASIIAMLLEARSYLKMSPPEQNVDNKEEADEVKTENQNGSFDKIKSKTQGPLTVHCSPGTGRTGTIISCDIALRTLELPTRSIDVPQIVYYVRRGRASSVRTREQYEFIYKVANMYATKLSTPVEN